MNRETHAISIDIKEYDDESIILLKAHGKLTHADYEVITPMFESILDKVPHAQAKVLADISQLDGWDLQAAWDDLKLGLKYGKNFTKIAIVGNKNWQGAASTVGSWFIAGEMRSFHSVDEAQRWLNES